MKSYFQRRYLIRISRKSTDEKSRLRGFYALDRYTAASKMLYCIVIMGGYLMLSNYQFIFWLLGYEPESISYMVTFFRLVVGIACILFLYIQNNIENMQKTEQELNMIQQLLYRQQEQYRVSQENIDLINRKCHDLKYQMEALRKLKDEKLIDEQLKELERSAMIYDSIFKTGNPVLDTVLAVVLLTVSMAAPVLGGSAAASGETGSENGGADGTDCRRRGGQRRTDSELRGGRGRADAMIRGRYDSTYRL